MIRTLIFLMALVFVCGRALLRGGAPERIVGATLIVGLIATWAVAIGLRGNRAGHFIGLEYGVLLVDCAMLLVLLAVALLADRFWPLWMTALHAFGVIGHLAKATAPDILPNVYHAAHAFSAWPGLLLLYLATGWHRRRLREEGGDRSWSICSPSPILRWQRAGPTG